MIMLAYRLGQLVAWATRGTPLGQPIVAAARYLLDRLMAPPRLSGRFQTDGYAQGGELWIVPNGETVTRFDGIPLTLGRIVDKPPADEERRT